MKPEMRQQLAQLPYEEKIRKVGELIRLSRKFKAQGIREDNPPSNSNLSAGIGEAPSNSSRK
jgi:hypothetical protein